LRFGEVYLCVDCGGLCEHKKQKSNAKNGTAAVLTSRRNGRTAVKMRGVAESAWKREEPIKELVVWNCMHGSKNRCKVWWHWHLQEEE
jgi:hypothetical protein